MLMQVLCQMLCKQQRAAYTAIVRLATKCTVAALCVSDAFLQVALIQGLLQSASSEPGQPGQPPQPAAEGYPAAEEHQDAAVVEEEDNESAAVQVATVDSFQV